MSITDDTFFLYSPYDLQEDVEFILSELTDVDRAAGEALLADVKAFIQNGRSTWTDEGFDALNNRYLDLVGDVDAGL